MTEGSLFIYYERSFASAQDDNLSIGKFINLIIIYRPSTIDQGLVLATGH